MTALLVSGGRMDLLLVRHADAGDATAFASTGRPDEERPLSEKGRRQMLRAAIAIRELLPGCDTVAASPLVRAVETAGILVDAFALAAPIQTPSLAPGTAPAEFVAWSSRFDDTQCVAAVGHEPHLSHLATWLISAQNASRVELKKGAACLISFPATPRAGEGTLQWLLQPRQLELLADRAQ